MIEDSDRERVRAAFKELRNLGFFARMNWWCCSSCGWADIPEERADNVVFFNKQAGEAFGGRFNCELKRDLYLQWAGNAEAIGGVLLRYFGDRVETPKDQHTTFIIRAAA